VLYHTECVYDDGVITVEPTTETEGVKTYTCPCGETKTEVIEKLPPVATNAPTTTATEEGTANSNNTTEKADNNASSSGCGGTVIGSLSLLSLVTLAAACTLKKKKD